MIPVLLRWLALWGLLLAGLSHAAVVDVPAAAERLPLGAAIEYFFDEDGRMAPEAALRDSRYRATGPDTPGYPDGLVLGFHNFRVPVLWIRLGLRNPGDAPVERWLHIEPERLERISLFVPAPGGGYARLENGLQVAVAQRPVPARSIAFPLRLEAGASQSVYLRVETRTFLQLMPVLWTPAAFERALRYEDLFAMLGIGTLLGMTLSSIVLYPLRRDLAALYMGCSVVCYCLFNLAYNGYGDAYLWPDHPHWDLRGAIAFLLLSQMGLNRFMGAFIPLRAYGWRWVGRCLDGLLLLETALLLAFLLRADFVKIAPLVSPLLLVGLHFNLGLSLAAQRKGYRPARYMTLGLLLALGVMITAVTKIGDWLPVSPLAAQIRWVAVAFIIHFPFHVAISRRVDLLRREKDAAQAQALAAQQQAAARLEAQVAERTGQLSAAKERAERADAAKGEFLARVSHELRTPLHTILGYAHLLRRDAAGQSGERLALLEEGGGHLAKLVDDLLDYARSQRAGLALHPEAAFLHRLLLRLKGHGAALADPRRHCFELRSAEDLPAVVRVDARRLEQVALILLSNAARYTDKGRITLAVDALAAEPGRARLRFAVEDSGPGLAASELERIFDPFERVGGGENTGGLGLGLAIARQIVRAMGGELRVDSRLGEGSRFWFEISLERASEEDIPTPFPDLDIVGYAGPPCGILLVEDHPANRRLLEQLLAELGFVVYAAGGVAEGLERLASASFDLALLDLRLPDGSAWDILRALRGDGTRSVPAVLLSAQPPRLPDDWEGMPGFDAVLLKPADGAEVLECVGGLLDLTWLRADGAPAGGDEAGHAVLPPAADCAELAGLARQGAVYEIEEWIARVLRDRPECGVFCREVEERLAALDFEGIAARLSA